MKDHRFPRVLLSSTSNKIRVNSIPNIFTSHPSVSGLPVPPERRCKACKRLETTLPHSLKRCKRCKVALYCTQDCQRVDWHSGHTQRRNSTSGPNPTEGAGHFNPPHGTCPGSGPFGACFGGDHRWYEGD